MLTIDVQELEYWDERTNEFVQVQPFALHLEHSLLSISKWESRHHKPYLGTESKTPEEVVDYIKCMTIDKNVDDGVYDRLTVENIQQLNEYIVDPMTATTIKDDGKKKNNGKFITSELIYAWMFELRIPKECERWHVNRLLTLIRVMDEERRPKKKMKKNDIYRQNAALNAARLAKTGSRG